MRFASPTLLAAALVCGLHSVPAVADTTLSASVSDSISTAVGSVSTSLKKSSQSSTKDDKVADGDYKVVNMVAVAEQPGMVRMQLQALADTGADGAFDLILPQKTVELNQIAAGAVVTARQRPYGTEFATGQARQAFFLVLQDDWFRELPSKPVVL